MNLVKQDSFIGFDIKRFVTDEYPRASFCSMGDDPLVILLHPFDWVIIVWTMFAVFVEKLSLIQTSHSTFSLDLVIFKEIVNSTMRCICVAGSLPYKTLGICIYIYNNIADIYIYIYMRTHTHSRLIYMVHITR